MDVRAPGNQSYKPPLAVDFDGTLSPSDILVDAFVQTLLRKPKALPSVVASLRSGRLAFKEKLLSIGAYQPLSIPLDDELLAFLRSEKSNGREIHLVTASPQSIADAVSERVGIFDSATGSKDGDNLKGDRKAQHLKQRFPDGFTYAGNDDCDLDVWRHAKSAITVDASPRVAHRLEKLAIPVERSFKRRWPSFKTWLKLIRIHQWSKNALMFVPLFLAHQYGDWYAISRTAIAFVCMGLVASATYILNDLSDLDVDRHHPTKRFRPLASAEISVRDSVVLAGVLGLAGGVGALLLDPLFALVLGIYVLLTLAYSLRLKAIPLLDVFVLGLLFTLRIIMGIVLLHVPPSPWLMVFSLFFFFSLSMAKRHVEIVRAAARGHTGKIKGRGYLASDAPMTLSLGVSSSTIAVTLLFLYVANDAYPAGYYRSPEWLWAVSPLVFLWTTRIWLKSHRGLLDDDPINFALGDKPSLALGLAVLVCFALAVL